MISVIYCKIRYIHLPIFRLVYVLYFKGTSHACLLEISVTHNENKIPILYLVINFIFVRSALQKLSLEHEYILRLLCLTGNWFVYFFC